MTLLHNFMMTWLHDGMISWWKRFRSLHDTTVACVPGNGDGAGVMAAVEMEAKEMEATRVALLVHGRICLAFTVVGYC